MAGPTDRKIAAPARSGQFSVTVPSVAVAIPCHNEDATIGKVVADFRAILPQAVVYVIDNNSSDESAARARAAGAVILRENRTGKGYVMQVIAEQVHADFVVVVDGDDTYTAEEAPKLLAVALQGDADMVVGMRQVDPRGTYAERFHQVGNHLIVSVLNRAFGANFQDALSGYRVFSKRFFQHVPMVARGFETEVEMTIQAFVSGMVVREVPITYRARPAGSWSKLRPFQDGYRILMTIVVLLRDDRPLFVFGNLAIVCLTIAGGAAGLRLLNYAGVTALPTPLLTGLLIWLTLAGTTLLGIGFILNTINRRFAEIRSLLRRSQ